MQILRWVFKLLPLYLLADSFSRLAIAEDDPVAGARCSELDRASLLSFKATILMDTTDILSSWRGGACCGGDWEGVSCNSQGRVTSLVLQRPAEMKEMYMRGTLSPSLGKMVFLETVVISGMKRISGGIPGGLAKLARLTYLVLEDNSLEGEIPASITEMANLNVLSLSGNRLTGKIPAGIGGLRKLQQLSLARNFLTGPLPAAVRSLASLENVDLSSNMLSGSIPDDVDALRNLTYLDLSGNRFSGKIPSSVFGHAGLQELLLNDNALCGNLSSGFNGLRSLARLHLGANNLSGPIPPFIAEMGSLWYLNLSQNAFTGALPAMPSTSLPALLQIDLSYNQLGVGTVPDWILEKEVMVVHLAGCKLRGAMPAFKQPGSLTSVDLSDNSISGGISGFFTNMTSLQDLKLSHNFLQIDVEHLELPEQLSTVSLHGNFLRGSLSRFLNKTSSSLEELDLSRNQISGNIPEFGKDSSLKVLILGSNNITGRIPDSISNLNQLLKLDLSRNFLTGSIPPSMGLLSNLKWLDLSINLLAGRIPNTLLEIRNITHGNFKGNLLCGEIPQGRPFNAFKPIAYAHNRCLCGKPLTPCRT